MRRFTHRKKKVDLSQNNRFKRWWLGIGGLVLILALAVFTIFKSNLFNIKNVEVEARDLDCVNDGELKEASLTYGQNLLFIDRENIGKNIKEKFICIQGVSLTSFLPDKIRINVSGREGVAAIFSLKAKEATSSAFLENIATPSAEEASEAFLVDSEGVIFSRDVKDLNMPTIFLYDSNLKLGKKLEGGTKVSLQILGEVKKLGFDRLTSQIIDNFFLIYPTNLSPKVIFRLDDRIDAQIASLQLILEKAKIDHRSVPTEVGIDAESLEFIDLRFDKPIVKFAPKKNG